MYTNVNKTAENPSASQKNVELKQKENIGESREVKETSATGREAVEVATLGEDAETTGKVSEVLSKSDEDSAGGLAGGAKPAKFNPAQIRAQLLKQLPDEKVMRKEIEKEIKNEIKYLHKKAMKMLRSPQHMNYFEMSNIVGKIRELKGTLYKLIKASFESLKTLWLRYVHGVM